MPRQNGFIQMDGVTDGTCTIGTVDACSGTADFGPNQGRLLLVDVAVTPGT